MTIEKKRKEMKGLREKLQEEAQNPEEHHVIIWERFGKIHDGRSG